MSSGVAKKPMCSEGERRKEACGSEKENKEEKGGEEERLTVKTSRLEGERTAIVITFVQHVCIKSEET